MNVRDARVTTHPGQSAHLLTASLYLRRDGYTFPVVIIGYGLSSLLPNSAYLLFPKHIWIYCMSVMVNPFYFFILVDLSPLTPRKRIYKS